MRETGNAGLGRARDIGNAYPLKSQRYLAQRDRLACGIDKVAQVVMQVGGFNNAVFIARRNGVHIDVDQACCNEPQFADSRLFDSFAQGRLGRGRINCIHVPARLQPFIELRVMQ